MQGLNVGKSPHPNAFYLGDPMTNGRGFRPETAEIPALVGTVYIVSIALFSSGTPYAEQRHSLTAI